uniref:DUF1985 domain-containing protein n=1 Tax=Macrostomum lignano TaxID=282301 RepID=A0A1I8G423_9PLAT
TSEKDRAKTTVLLNDLCNLALRLFYTGKCKEIVINCKPDTIVDIFSGKNGETMKKFLAWFGLLCAKLMQSNEPQKLPAEQLYGAPLIEVVKLLDDKSKENQSTEDQTEIVQFVLIPCAATLCFFSYNEEHTEPNKQAEELQNWIAEFFLTKLTKEVSIRKSLLPSQLHRLRLRLALLTILCYSGLNLEGKDRYSDCIYELLRFACEPRNEVAPIGFRYKRYKQIEIQFDFSLHESESDRYKNRKSLLASVKTYSDRQSDILHYSRGDSSMDSSPASSSVMLQGLAEKCQPCQPTEGRVLTAIIYNCDGKRCKEKRVQFWCSSGMQSTGVNEYDIFRTMACTCDERKKFLCEGIKQRARVEKDAYKGIFVVGHIFFDVRAAMQSFQPTYIPRSFAIRKHIQDYLACFCTNPENTPESAPTIKKAKQTSEGQ